MNVFARSVSRERQPAIRPVPLLRPTGAVWFAWRRHRAAYRIAAALAVLAALWAVWEHQQLVSGIHDYALACRRTPAVCESTEDTGGHVAPPVSDSIHLLFEQAPSVLRFLPLVVGALLGAPLFAQDLENGTYRLDWTQSVGRREWAAAKLVTAAAVTTAAAIVLTLPVTWWWGSVLRGHQLTGPDGNAWRRTTFWVDWSLFPFTGPVGVAHLLLALMTGAVVGMYMRRALPAVALAAAASQGWQLTLDQLRPRLLPAHVTRGTGLDNYPDVPLDSWQLSSGYVHADGRLTEVYPCAYSGGQSAPQDFHSCLRAHDIVTQYSRVLLPDQIVPLQLIETGICLAAAAALAVLCLHGVRRIAA
ncbi:cell wall protein [Streptomyces sp. NPDC026672]|uniref:cell wall protein n=1 Tax=unclassified Streptomyces TaxID=2593676 RepID=UPI0033C6521F